MLLAPEGAALCESGFAPGGGAQDRAAAGAGDRGLRVAEDGRDHIAPRALHVHEVAVGILHEALQLVRVQPLLLGRRVKQVHGQRHLCNNKHVNITRITHSRFNARRMATNPPALT